MSNVRTRFAPSPTGRMHVGNLRTALYTYLVAKHEGGDFVLRIEDTDQERYMDGAIDIIYRTLEKTGLIHDEGPDKDKGYGPYVQSDRCKSGLYMEYAKQLVEKGAAYYCFCTPERIEGLRKTVAESFHLILSLRQKRLEIQQSRQKPIWNSKRKSLRKRKKQFVIKRTL